MRIGRHAVAAASMFIGSAIVFGGVLAMNLFSAPPKKEEKEASTEFKVEKKPPPPKPKPKKQEVQKRRTTSVKRSVAAAPDISSSLTGVSFGLPSFEADFSSLATDSLLGGANKSMVMTEDSVDRTALASRPVAPEYPSRARQKGIEGYVTFRVLVSSSGSVQQSKVVDSDPPGAFEDAAKAAIAQWEFTPGEYQGTPVSMWVKQTIRFKLGS
jgi:protein TonB